MLHSLFATDEPVVVHSHGALEPDGTLVLDQTILQGTKSSERAWQIRNTGDGQYTGTLTDASGPITAEVTGNRLRIQYSMGHWGLRVEQRIFLANDQRTALNEMTVRFLGITVANLTETIRRL